MDVILLGPPGAGKGVQATMLIDALGLTHVSTGELLRRHRDEGTDLGHKAARYMATGRLVPDALVIEMILGVLADAPGGLLLDGFPRTLAQAQALGDALEITGALLVDVPDDAIIDRIAGRRMCLQGHIYHVTFDPPVRDGICDRDGERLFRREDDDPETVRERLRVYHELTEPAIAYYAQRRLLRRVDGSGAPADVYRELLAAAVAARDD
jgi:adenylate kinase